MSTVSTQTSKFKKLNGASTMLDNVYTDIKVQQCLKPMDSFGRWRKLKFFIFVLLMQNFIELYELLMPC